MDFSATNQPDAESRIPKTDGLGLPVPTNSMNGQTDTKNFTTNRIGLYLAYIRTAPPQL
jgi:hypothetical protein